MFCLLYVLKVRLLPITTAILEGLVPSTKGEARRPQASRPIQVCVYLHFRPISVGLSDGDGTESSQASLGSVYFTIKVYGVISNCGGVFRMSPFSMKGFKTEDGILIYISRCIIFILSLATGPSEAFVLYGPFIIQGSRRDVYIVLANAYDEEDSLKTSPDTSKAFSASAAKVPSYISC